MIYVRNETRVYGLLMLLANVGEFPMCSLGILGNKQSWTKLIYELQQPQDFCISATGDVKRFQMLTVSGKGQNKTIRLHRSAISALSAVDISAQSFYFADFEGHRFSGSEAHIIRNHRVAEAAAMCMNSGVEIRKWALEDLHDQYVRYQQVEAPLFYDARAVKGFFEDEHRKTDFTRLVGTIVYPNGSYAVYNTMNQAMQWNGQGEVKARMLLEDIFYPYPKVTASKSAILFGRNLLVAQRTMEYAFLHHRKKHRLDTVYRHVHFIPMNAMGQKMLQILTRRDWQSELWNWLYADLDLMPWSEYSSFEYDACDVEENTYCFSHLDGDLCRLVRFKIAMHSRPQHNYVIDCYQEQLPLLRAYLDIFNEHQNVHFRTHNIDDVYTDLFERS